MRTSSPPLTRVIGLGAFSVHAHLAGAHESVDQAFRHALELAGQEVVDALAVAVFGDLRPFRARAEAGRRGLAEVCMSSWIKYRANC